MIRHLLIWLILLWAAVSLAQNPSSVFRISQREIIIPCGETCATITATVPNIRQSGSYVVQAVPYSPFPYTGGTELIPLYADDIYSSTISLPFPVCFYGATYNSLVVGSNGIVTFDITNAGKRNNFSQITSFIDSTPVAIPYAGGLQNTLAKTYYAKASIMGVYHDIFPFNNGQRRIEWRLEGVAPKRRFIASYKDVPLYSCTDITATHQIVVYESTGVVEVYVQDKPVCRAWNGGLAILGMQNFTRDKAVFPPGRNVGRWGTTKMNEAYRFTPSAGLPQFKKAELLAAGQVVALADTMSSTNGERTLKFDKVCPATDSMQYLLRVTYRSCVNAEDVVFEDSLVVRKEKLDIGIKLENPTCTSGGSLLVAATGTASSFTYSLNGGVAAPDNLFSDLQPGTYEITVSSPTCTKTVTETLVLQNDLSLTAPASITVCEGETFTPQVISDATSFQWSPATGISNAGDLNPRITGQRSTSYTVTATKGRCQSSTTMNVVVKPLPVVNAGLDQTIVQGDVVQFGATASAGAYRWTPSTGLSDPTVLQPQASPTATTTYQLSVTANGCTASDDVTISVAPYCVKPMEAFSPNGDGTNDVWLITTGSCLSQAKVEVFNRYGGIVYHSADYKNNWNGSYNGKPLPDGTYYFIITYQLINGKTVLQRGNVTILR